MDETRWGLRAAKSEVNSVDLVLDRFHIRICWNVKKIHRVHRDRLSRVKIDYLRWKKDIAILLRNNHDGDVRSWYQWQSYLTRLLYRYSHKVRRNCSHLKKYRTDKRPLIERIKIGVRLFIAAHGTGTGRTGRSRWRHSSAQVKRVSREVTRYILCPSFWPVSKVTFPSGSAAQGTGKGRTGRSWWRHTSTHVKSVYRKFVRYFLLTSSRPVSLVTFALEITLGRVKDTLIKPASRSE